MKSPLVETLSGACDDTVDYAEARQLSFGASKDTLRAAIRAGHIRAWRLGHRTVRLHRGDVIAWAESSRMPALDGGERR